MTEYRNTETGTWTGTGSGTLDFTPGWPAGYVHISNWLAGNKFARKSFIKVASMSGSDCIGYGPNSGGVVNGITLTSTGFQVVTDTGDNLNESGVTHYWMAVRAGPWLDAGVTTGTGTGVTQTITTGRQPLMVRVILLGGNSPAALKAISQSGARATHMQFSVDTWTPLITITSTGFQITGGINDSGFTIYWYAFYFHSPTVFFDMAYLIGDGSYPRTVTLGQQPKHVYYWKGQETGSDGFYAFKYPDQSGGNYYETDADQNEYTTGGITLSSTGFSLASGGGQELNASGSDNYYHYAAFYR